ncbi:MAG: TonB-dependent receptor [bacterium]
MQNLFTRCKAMAVWILLAMFSVAALAGTTGKIAGEVKDKSTGQPLPGVNVVLEGTTLGAATDMNGRYYILLIAPGTYNMVASMIGYQATKISNVKVNVDLTTSVDFELSSTTLELGEAIEIVAERPLIQKDGVTTMQVTEAQTVENMVADDFKDVLTLNSGISTTVVRDGLFTETAETGEGQYYVRGGRGNELAVMVDGMYVRDAFSGGLGTEISNGAIEELQVISGNFNAEYGNAMSGVLNLITQDGGSQTTFRLRGFTDAIFGKSSGEYTFVERYQQVSDHGHLTAANWGTNQGQASLGGPLPGMGDRVKYFLAGEYFETDGSIGVLQNEIARRGTAKLSFNMGRTMKLSLSANVNREDLQIYQHAFAHDQHEEVIAVSGDSTIFPPNIPPNNFAGNDRIDSRVLQGIASWTHTLSAKAFYEIKLQRFSREYFNRVNDDIEAYNRNPIQYNDPEDFVINGYQPRFIDQEDRVYQAKFDVTYQVNIEHNLKAGLDFNHHRIWRHQILPTGDIANLREDMYTFYPIEAALYVQDKMEFKDLVINLGVRLDRFEPRDSVAIDPNLPLGARKIAGGTTRLSPRVGMAHPISDRANLHFSYGHFYQVPEYDKIVFNRRRHIDIFRPTLGNSDLRPQKTVAFEVGWDQELSQNLAITVTGFYKDYQNLLATDPYPDARPAAVTYYINQDFANARGVEFNMRTRRLKNFEALLGYTIQRAEGNSSNPLDTRDDLLARPPRVPLKQLIILDWDRPHKFNFNLDYRFRRNEGPTIAGGKWLQDFGVNLTGRFESGLPYTPTDTRGQRIADENVARMPSIWQLDLRVDKGFAVGRSKAGLFFEITNLTNRVNVSDVYTDSGLPLDTRDPTYTQFGKIDPYNLYPQRNIRIGAELEF